MFFHEENETHHRSGGQVRRLADFGELPLFTEAYRGDSTPLNSPVVHFLRAVQCGRMARCNHGTAVYVRSNDSRLTAQAKEG